MTRAVEAHPPPTCRRRMLLGLAASSAACWLGCSEPLSRFGSWQAPLPASPQIAALEQRMFARLNADRASAGLASLRYDPFLADVARAHSLDMRQARYFSHRSPTTGELEDRLDRAAYLALEMRENLAIAADVERAQDNLLRSPGHRANILATSVSDVGIGIVLGSSGDPRGLTVTQIFTRPARLQTPEQAEAELRTAIAQLRATARLPPLQRHPRLTLMASRHLPGLPAEPDEPSVDALANLLATELAQPPSHPIAAVHIVAQAVFDAREVPLVGARNARAQFLAIASTAVRDRRGRPRLKILVLFGLRE